MGSVLIDTGIVIASLDRLDAHHQAAMDAVEPYRLADAQFLMSTVTLAELLVDREKKRLETIRGFAESLGPNAVVHVDARIADRAGALRSRRKSWRLPDALIAATADVYEVDVMLTTDRKLSGHERGKLVGV